MRVTHLAVLAVSLVIVSSGAIAAELKNLNGKTQLLIVKANGKAEAVRLANNESISTKEKDILFIIGKQRVLAGANESYVFKNDTLVGMNDEAKKALAAQAAREAAQKNKRKKNKRNP